MRMKAIRPSGMKVSPFSDSKERARNFRRWFGDSKVVDTEGNPMVVYYGTTSDVCRFELNCIESDDAFFFTTDRDHAAIYADGLGGNVMSVYLSMNNPYEIDVRDWNEGVEGSSPEDILMTGYDGFIIRDQEGGDTYAVFRPEQIKSAIGNTGAFDPDCPDVCDCLIEPMQSSDELVRDWEDLEEGISP